CSAPPFPPEAVTLAGPRQVAPNSLLNPVLDIREAAARVAERKVLHPTAQDGIDARNHLCDGPRQVTPKNLLESSQQRRPLLAAGRPQRHPSASPTANPTELKAQKSEALTLRQVHSPTLLLVHLDLQFCQLLP